LPEEIVIDEFRFYAFLLNGTTDVMFEVVPITNRDITQEDEEVVDDILCYMGKWESLIKTSSNLLSDLGIIHPEPAVIQNLEKPSGIELYETQIQRVAYTERLHVRVTLEREERHRRELLGVPLISVEEIQGQLCNIPKWNAFEKTMQAIKKTISTRT
jgi:hypothetical protein